MAPETPVPAKDEPPQAASLFDTAPEPVRAHGDDGSAAGSGPAIVASETDEEEEILREAYADGETEELDETA